MSKISKSGLSGEGKSDSSRPGQPERKLPRRHPQVAPATIREEEQSQAGEAINLPQPIQIPQITKRKRQKKKYRLKRYLWLPWEMAESSAFRSIRSPHAIRILLRFYQKLTWTYGRGRKKMISFDEDLVFTYQEAEYLGISTASFHRNIKKLVEKGFIDIKHQGGAYGPDYSRFRISSRWRDYGTPQFKQVRKKRVLQHGLDVQARKAAKLRRKGSQ